MIRTLGGIVAGMAAAIAFIMIAETIGYQLPAPSIQIVDGELSAPPVQPLSTILFSALGWAIGALAGGFVAIVVSEQRWPAWAVAGAVVIANLFNFALTAFPLWAMAAGVALPLLGAWCAQRLASIRAARRERRQLSE